MARPYNLLVNNLLVNNLLVSNLIWRNRSAGDRGEGGCERVVEECEI